MRNSLIRIILFSILITIFIVLTYPGKKKISLNNCILKNEFIFNNQSKVLNKGDDYYLTNETIEDIINLSVNSFVDNKALDEVLKKDINTSDTNTVIYDTKYKRIYLDLTNYYKLINSDIKNIIYKYRVECK